MIICRAATSSHVVALPFFAPFELATKSQKAGFTVYGVSLAIYFSSWLPLIAVPASWWSTSAVGSLAPAHTPLVWLLGLALLMRRLHWPSPYRWWCYLVLSVAFLGGIGPMIVQLATNHSAPKWPAFAARREWRS